MALSYGKRNFGNSKSNLKAERRSKEGAREKGVLVAKRRLPLTLIGPRVYCKKKFIALLARGGCYLSGISPFIFLVWLNIPEKKLHKLS